jgi:hypothetical protein
MLKPFLFVMLAVLGGIYIYSKLSKKPAVGPLTTAETDKLNSMFGQGNLFAKTDPVTGGLVQTGNPAGTVEFSAQGN